MCRSPHWDTHGWGRQQDSRKSLLGSISRVDSRWMSLGRTETSIQVCFLQKLLLNYWIQNPLWRWKNHRHLWHRQKKKKKPGFKLRWKLQTSQSSSAIIHSCPCKKMAWTRWLMNHREWLLVFQQAGSLLSRLMFLYILRGKSIPSVSAFWVCLHTVERVKSFFWGLLYKDANATHVGSVTMASWPPKNFTSKHHHLRS